MSNPVTIKELREYHAQQAVETRKKRKYSEVHWSEHAFHEDAVEVLERLEKTCKVKFSHPPMEEEDHLGYHVAKIEILESDVLRLREKNRVLSQETIATFEELRKKIADQESQLLAKAVSVAGYQTEIDKLRQQLSVKEKQVAELYRDLQRTTPSSFQSTTEQLLNFSVSAFCMATAALALTWVLANILKHGL
jgi:RNA binding exosome subunit